jgi:peptidylprolyl isomerase
MMTLYHSLLLLTLAISTDAFVPSPRFARCIVRSTATESDVVAYDNYKLNDDTQELVMKDVVVGNGEAAKVGDILDVKYKGTIMATGKEFANGPLSFKVGEGKVLPGLDVGVEGLRVGGKRVLRIPPKLGYGSRGARNVIPPNSDIEMEVELCSMLPQGALGEALMNWGFGKNPKTFGTAGMLLLLIVLPNILSALNIQ